MAFSRSSVILVLALMAGCTADVDYQHLSVGVHQRTRSWRRVRGVVDDHDEVASRPDHPLER